MSSAIEQSTVISDASARLSRQLDDAPWLAELRSGAAAAADALALPDSRRERAWKYLDISGLKLEPYAPMAGQTSLSEGVPGLTLTTFAAADAPAQAVIQQYLGSRVDTRRSKLTAMHYAYLQDGVLVQTAANAEVGNVKITRHYAGAGALGTPHTLIVTGPNSTVSVIEDFRSGEDDMLMLPALEVVPGHGSQVRYTALNRWGTKTRVFTDQSTIAEQESAYTSLNVVTGGLVVKGYLQSTMVARGSSSELYGVTLGDGKQHADFYTVQDHVGADTRSDLLYKSALKDESRSVYYGLTRVGLEARNSDANQEQRNLLLSHGTRADSDPVLEILTSNIIRCSHGSTTGPVDEEQLYYLEARGIPREKGEDLLVRAFLGQVLDRIPDEALREELEAVVDAKLERAG